MDVVRENTKRDNKRDTKRDTKRQNINNQTLIKNKNGTKYI